MFWVESSRVLISKDEGGNSIGLGAAHCFSTNHKSNAGNELTESFLCLCARNPDFFFRHINSFLVPDTHSKKIVSMLETKISLLHERALSWSHQPRWEERKIRLRGRFYNTNYFDDDALRDMSHYTHKKVVVPLSTSVPSHKETNSASFSSNNDRYWCHQSFASARII